MKRKIIQIALEPHRGKIVALCNDGSLWIKEDGWVEIHTDEIYDDDEVSDD